MTGGGILFWIFLVSANLYCHLYCLWALHMECYVIAITLLPRRYPRRSSGSETSLITPQVNRVIYFIYAQGTTALETVKTLLNVPVHCWISIPRGVIWEWTCPNESATGGTNIYALCTWVSRVINVITKKNSVMCDDTFCHETHAVFSYQTVFASQNSKTKAG